MAWIESHQDLGSNPKTKRAARLLGVSRPAVVGHLQFLWWWALDHAFDGDVSSFDAMDLADAAEWEGDPDEFVEALVDCGPGDKAGFLIRRDSRLELNDWHEFTAALRSGREASLKANHTRHHVNKGVSEPSCHLCSSSDRSPTGVRPEDDGSPDAVRSDSTDRTEPTEPDQTEPEPTPGAPAGPAAPPKARPARGTRLPDDWRPDQEPELVAALGGQAAAAREWAKFRDYWTAQPGQRGRKVDWQATWRNWLRKAAEHTGGNRTRAAPTGPPASEFATSRRLQ